jgi:hypothetical protein
MHESREHQSSISKAVRKSSLDCFSDPTWPLLTPHAHPAPVCKRRREIGRHQHRARVPRLDPAKLAEKPEDGVRHLDQRELLTEADSRPAAEGNILPPGAKVSTDTPIIHGDQNKKEASLPDPEILPPLGAELLRVWPVDGFVAVESMCGPPHRHALGHQDRLLSIRPAASREDGIAVAGARVDSDGREKAKGW